MPVHEHCTAPEENFRRQRHITGDPAIEAVFDAFGVVDCIEWFEVSQRPTIHIALPHIFRMMYKLDNITNGLQVWRVEGQALA